MELVEEELLEEGQIPVADELRVVLHHESVLVRGVAHGRALSGGEGKLPAEVHDEGGEVPLLLYPLAPLPAEDLPELRLAFEVVRDLAAADRQLRAVGQRGGELRRVYK